MLKAARRAIFIVFLAAFILVLPVILLYSLGYRTDLRHMRLIRTGILSLRSVPDGASIYINGVLTGKKTPQSIEGITPGTYSVKVEFPGYYPWEKEIRIKAKMVTRAEKIYLFARRSNVAKLSDADVTSFSVSPKGYLYYVARPEGILYRSELDGKNIKVIGGPGPLIQGIRNERFSQDKEKVLYFNDYQLWAVHLSDGGSVEVKDTDESHRQVVLDLGNSGDGERIIDAFWHSSNQYVVVITNRRIQVTELDGLGGRNTFELVSLHNPYSQAYYETRNDTLYFADSEETPDGKGQGNIYRIEIGPKITLPIIQEVKQGRGEK
jgi:hypothetical protein